MLHIAGVFIFKSPINGLGLFAYKNFKAGEMISKLRGNPREIIFLNHSCLPNAFILQPIEDDMQTHILYSKRIKKGEEITCDYRIGKLYRDLWEKTVKGKCTCPKCRV